MPVPVIPPRLTVNLFGTVFGYKLLCLFQQLSQMTFGRFNACRRGGFLDSMLDFSIM